ncbi:MAG TPA: hypothetical protein VLR26_04880 [Frankiaceae bacterium]|nr:hypothetical protein [Frankiaceae bacterium]
MDYQAAHAAFFQPREDAPTPDVVAGATASRRLRDAAEPLAMHAVWSRRVNGVLAERGMDFLSSYVWGRAASLGEPAPDVAAAAFAWFEPGFVRAMYDEGRSRVSRDDLLTLRTGAAVDGLQEILATEDVSEVADAADRLRRALDSLDMIGRPLFAGLRALPWPAEPAGQLWRACDLLREYRGDGHIAAVASSGLSPVEMNILTELWVGLPLLSYTATRAWSEDQMGAAIVALQKRGWVEGEELTEDGRVGRRAIEDRTDAAESALVTALGPDIDALAYLLDGWGQLCIEADAFPPDPFKRWAG